MALHSLPASIIRTDEKILTVYLNADQRESGNLSSSFENQLGAELQSLAQSLKEENELQEFAAALTLVRKFIDTYHPQARCLAVFANARELLHSRDLNVDVPSVAQWGLPHIKPYIEALDEFERQIIVVTDKWHARILSVLLGNVETSVDVYDDQNTSHVRTTGTDHIESQTRFQRHADELTRKHLKHVVRELETLTGNHPSDRIILGGNVEAVAELFRQLPKHLRTSVVGTVSLSLTDNIEHIVTTAQQLGSRAERDFEVKAVGNLLEAVGRKKGVTGVHHTLQAILDNRVFSLLYADGITVPGKECVGCGAIFAADSAITCSYCGNDVRNTEDLLDAMLLAVPR